MNIINILNWICIIILIYFAVLWLGYLMFLLATFSTIIRKYLESNNNNMISSINHNSSLPITIIIPAYNEALRIENTITALLNSDYQNIHIIIINDGSTDSTLQLLIDKYQLVPVANAFKTKIKTGKIRAYYQSKIIKNFIVIDKEHSPYLNSAADSVNAGLNICRTPVYLTVDADTILEPEALSRILFVYLTNPHCVAVGGDIYVPDPTQIKNGKMMSTNIPRNFLLGTQVTEYLRSFLYGREGWTIFGGALCHPGAFTLLETQAVHEVGGYDSYNFSYDAEIIIKIHHHMRKNHYPYSVVYAPSAISWSIEPNKLKNFWRQRSYWQRGLLRCIALHKQMILNPNYGITGLFAFPYYILFEIFGPVVEGISYIIVLILLCISSVNYSNILWLLFLAWGYMMFITMSCVVLSIVTYNKYYRKMDIIYIVLLTTVDMLFFRQYRAFCAISSSIHYIINRLRGKPL